MELTVLGSSGTYADRGGACTGYLISAGGAHVWLDCGPGTLGRLGGFAELEDLDAIVISHEHPDHCLELPILYYALRYHRKRSLLPVFATAGTRSVIAGIVGKPTEAVFDWRIVSGGDVVEIGGGRWSFDRVDHPPETLAVKVEAEGRSFVFSSDTGPGWTGERFAEDVDLLLCEATFARNWREEDATPFPGRPFPVGRPEGTSHLLASEAGSIAQDRGVGRLLLTHLAPGSDRNSHRRKAQERYDGAVEVVSDCTTYVI